jgi:hypothetical protein
MWSHAPPAVCAISGAPVYWRDRIPAVCFSAVHDCLHPDDPRPQPPMRPTDDDCCRGGCTPCVFDLYDEASERYRAALAAWEARHPEHAKHTNHTKPANQKTKRAKPRP